MHLDQFEAAGFGADLAGVVGNEVAHGCEAGSVRF